MFGAKFKTERTGAYHKLFHGIEVRISSLFAKITMSKFKGVFQNTVGIRVINCERTFHTDIFIRRGFVLHTKTNSFCFFQ